MRKEEERRCALEKNSRGRRRGQGGQARDYIFVDGCERGIYGGYIRDL